MALPMEFRVKAAASPLNASTKLVSNKADAPVPSKFASSELFQTRRTPLATPKTLRRKEELVPLGIQRFTSTLQRTKPQPTPVTPTASGLYGAVPPRPKLTSERRPYTPQLYKPKQWKHVEPRYVSEAAPMLLSPKKAPRTVKFAETVASTVLSGPMGIPSPSPNPSPLSQSIKRTEHAETIERVEGERVSEADRLDDAVRESTVREITRLAAAWDETIHGPQPSKNDTDAEVRLERMLFVGHDVRSILEQAREVGKRPMPVARRSALAVRKRVGS
ncbi:hypothetical protein J8273_4474 [Carpediemonas membranifera]|uniref:Uncharacterized protein n=1 Tax=Carpediemonas membranifera TaxID=201153 RepID=A0A8J6ATE6_9EUKA|nr:hypothetical protein J8273_4474 [Carpediemonas membranifera]|eukprot:KAG9394111.1 hypothetical protein J8273_4474 [Carpediemonas membranifera]